jgi:hypothetical protein
VTRSACGRAIRTHATRPGSQFTDRGRRIYRTWASSAATIRWHAWGIASRGHVLLPLLHHHAAPHPTRGVAPRNSTCRRSTPFAAAATAPGYAARDGQHTSRGARQSLTGRGTVVVSFRPSNTLRPGDRRTIRRELGIIGDLTWFQPL